MPVKGILIASCVLAAALPVTTHFLVDAYSRHQVATNRLTTVEHHLKALERSRQNRRSYQAFLEQAQEFVNHAQRSGAIRSAWDRYSVDLQRQVYFDELENLLAQADHGPAFYFQPALLDIRLATGEKSEEESAQNTQEEGDVTLTLRGSFLVRRR